MGSVQVIDLRDGEEMAASGGGAGKMPMQFREALAPKNNLAGGQPQQFWQKQSEVVCKLRKQSAGKSNAQE